jgi:hypothetical protein
VSDGGYTMTTVIDLRNAYCKRTTTSSEQECLRLSARSTRRIFFTVQSVTADKDRSTVLLTLV